MLAAWLALLALAPLPPNITLSLTDRSIVFASDGAVVSTALLCPDYAFDTFGPGGPRLSPDQHWLLVDVRGPFAPANVPRTHALVDVRSGALVLSPDFPMLLAIPAATGELSWASGERATLRYRPGSTVRLHEPLRRRVPPVACAKPGGPRL
ncbi:MAG: hypothetical protein NVS2B3_06090 [Vulcanimicrobiaceae bacterium]